MWSANILLAVLGLFLLRRLDRGAPIDPLEFLRRFRRRLGFR
jgi:hypothetical protein